MKDRNPQILKYGIDLSRKRDEHKHWACLFGGIAVVGFLLQLFPSTLGERIFFIILTCLEVGAGIYEAIAWHHYAQEYERCKLKNGGPIED